MLTEARLKNTRPCPLGRCGRPSTKTFCVLRSKCRKTEALRRQLSPKFKRMPCTSARCFLRMVYVAFRRNMACSFFATHARITRA